MKCPCCGSEMTIDNHRKYDIPMCYECGYIEGRALEKINGTTNFAHLQSSNLNEAIAFISHGFNIPKDKVECFLESVSSF